MLKQNLFLGSEAVVEAARHKGTYSGFLAGLFEADVRWDLLTSVHIPDVSHEALDFVSKFKGVVGTLDPERVDSDGELPEPLLKTLARIGAFGMKIPKHFGGQGLTQYEYQKIAILCGSFDASLTVLLSAAQSIGVPEPLRLFGTDEQKAKYLPRLAQGEISGFALTERHVGCDIATVETCAVRVKENGKTIAYRLTGEKFFITNSAKGDGEFLASMLVVIARIVDSPDELRDPKIPKRYGAFIVESEWPGCSVTRLRFEGVRGIYNGAPKFDHVYVPVENRLGTEEDGLRIALSTLTIGRLTLPAACLGGLKQCLSVMRWWGRTRVQWNKPIGEHNLIGEKLCRAAAYTLALEAIMALCGAWADNKSDLRLESAAVKIIGTEWYWGVVNDLFQMRGGRGFMTVDSQRRSGELGIPAMRLLRDARINLVWEGTSEILRLWMAREALSPYIDHGLAVLHGPTAARVKAAVYYARLASRSWLPSPKVRLVPVWCGKEYAGWVRLIESSTKGLTRAALAATFRHRQGLHHKQLLLKHLVDHSLLLFPLAATCWYASQPEVRARPGLYELTSYLRQDIVEKLDPASSRIGGHSGHKKDTTVSSLAKRIMAGEYEWLEEGILPLLDQ